jgi:hypothetical protein
MAACALAAAAACDQPAGPSSDVPALTGEWKGTIVHGVAGPGLLALSASQRGPGLFGTWAATFPDAAFNQSGTFSGTIIGMPFVLFLRPAAPIVCGPDTTLSGTLTVNTTLSGNRMSGPFTILSCGGVISGNVDVSRR